MWGKSVAGRSRTTFQKRQKELARAEKQREKAARRMQRKLEKHPTDAMDAMDVIDATDVTDTDDTQLQDAPDDNPVVPAALLSGDNA